MYLYDQGRTSSVSLGIGRLDVFGKFPKKTEPDLAKATLLEEQMRTLAVKAKQLEEQVRALALEQRQTGAKVTAVDAPLGFWNGVDRAYEDWLKVRDKTDITKWPIHQVAAEAAMKRGDAISRYKRVTIALSLLKHANGSAEEHARLKAEREDLEGNWALVDLHLIRRLKSNLEYPLGPVSRGDSRAAFKWASEKLRERRKFNGLLPIEPFKINGAEISLKYDCALSRVSIVHVLQNRDGTFKIDCIPRPATAEVNPPTLID